MLNYPFLILNIILNHFENCIKKLNILYVLVLLTSKKKLVNKTTSSCNEIIKENLKNKIETHSPNGHCLPSDLMHLFTESIMSLGTSSSPFGHLGPLIIYSLVSLPFISQHATAVT